LNRSGVAIRSRVHINHEFDIHQNCVWKAVVAYVMKEDEGRALPSGEAKT
jgi:hypothetical protein